MKNILKFFKIFDISTSKNVNQTVNNLSKMNFNLEKYLFIFSEPTSETHVCVTFYNSETCSICGSPFL